jgi:hypothetical protein
MAPEAAKVAPGSKRALADAARVCKAVRLSISVPLSDFCLFSGDFGGFQRQFSGNSSILAVSLRLT